MVSLSLEPIDDGCSRAGDWEPRVVSLLLELCGLSDAACSRAGAWEPRVVSLSLELCGLIDDGCS